MLILCIKIFLVRILDVSLGTIRTVTVVKGKTFLASLIGFVEIFVWFVIVKEALNTSSNSLWIAFSYAGGFATGTYIGGILSSKFIESTLSVKIITSNNTLANHIREAGYAATVMDIKGREENSKFMILVEINNKSYSNLKDIVEKIDKSAFVVVDETKYVQNGFIK